MAINDVDVLLTVDVDAVETLKQLAELRGETAALREQQKELRKSTGEGSEEFSKLGAQIKVNTAEIKAREKSILSAVAKEKAQSDSIKGMRLELNQAKDAYASLSKAERESADGQELLKKTADLNAELKELEASYGDNQRKVGEYERAGVSLRTEVRQLTESLATMLTEGRSNSEEFQEMSQRLALLKDAMSDVNAQATQMASDTGTFDTMAQAAQGVTAALTLWKSASSALGFENEAVEKTMKSLMTAMAALQALTTLQNLAQKQSNLYRLSSNLLKKTSKKLTEEETVATVANAAAKGAETTAENAATAAKTKGVVITKLITVVQRAWNAALNSNPVILLLSAITLLITGVVALAKAQEKGAKEARAAAAAEEDFARALEASEVRLKALELAHDNNARSVQLGVRMRVAALRQAGADEQKIRDAQLAGEAALRDAEIAFHRQRQKEADELATSKELEVVQLEKALSKVREGSKRWGEYEQKLNEARASLLDFEKTAADAKYKVLELGQDAVEAAAEVEAAAKERAAAEAKSSADSAKSAVDAAKARVDAAINAYTKELEEQRKFTEARLKAEASYQNGDLATRQEHARKIFDLGQSTELAKLELLKKYNRITETEYANSMAIMQAQLVEFSNGQINEVNNFFEGERAAILGMLKKSLDEELGEIERRYTDTLDRMAQIQPPKMRMGESGDDYAARLSEYEAFVLEQSDIALRLEAQKNEQIAAIQKADAASRAKEIETSVKDAYAVDLAAHSNNERAKLDITEQMLREQVEKKRAAGLETYEEEAQLEALALQHVQLNLNRDLLLADDNAKKKYEAKKAALEAERALTQDNADRQLEIESEMADASAELYNSRIEAVGQWRDATMELFNGFNDLMSAGLDAEKQKVEDTYSAEADALKKRFDQGLLTQAQYDKEVANLEKKKEKDLAKIEREKAVRERAAKVFQVVTDTAMGVSKSVASSPLTFGLPWSAFVAATGALQLATILKEPLPKAARGGLIAGPSHQAGGAIIEAEGGEAIMTKRAVSMFGPVLSALNALGGGVPFAAPLSDGGYTLRAAAFGSPAASAEEIASAFKRVKIYTTVEDINRGQEQYAEVLGRGALPSTG